MRLAEDLDDVAGPGLQAAWAQLGDRAAAADHVLAALLDTGQLRQQLLVGGVPVADQEPGEEPQDPVIAAAAGIPAPAARSAQRAGCG